MFNALPNFDLLRGGDLGLFGVPSQGSANKYSQLTPRRPSQSSLSPNSNPALLPLDLSSSLCARSFRTPSDFGHRESPLAHRLHDFDAMPEFQPFVDDEPDLFNGTALDFDADGNLIAILDDEPQLPPLPGADLGGMQVFHDSEGAVGEFEEQLVLGSREGQVIAMGNGVLGGATASGALQATEQPTESYVEASATTETEQASAHNQPSRRRKATVMLDQVHYLSRPEIRSWDANYVENMSAGRKRLKTTTPAQARRNALALTYGNRIAGVGLAQDLFGVAHPLAAQYAGQALYAQLHGLAPSEVDFGTKNKRGRRRKSSEALGEDVWSEEGRRSVRPRIEEDAELGRGQEQGEVDKLVFGDDTAPEMGLDAAAPMEDRHSSSMMPWSRPGSVARGQGSAQKLPAHSPSPLHGRGSVLASIERHSDPVETPARFAGGDFGSADSLIDFGDDTGALALALGTDAYASSAGLDAASQAFLGYATATAAEKGILLGPDGEARLWVSFEELASPGTHDKAVAAQAFLHVLSLATKCAVVVHQDGIDDNEPFGAIRVGVPAPRPRAASVDELA